MNGLRATPRQTNARRTRIIGKALMLAASMFFILASPWYVRTSYSGTSLWPMLSVGMTFGITALALTLLTLWKAARIMAAPVASILSVLVAAYAFFWTVAGDSQPRLTVTIFVTTLVYLAGSIPVNLESFRPQPSQR